MTSENDRRRLASILLIFLGFAAPQFIPGLSTTARASSSSSAFCHSTDGTFTTCPDGHQEWSDITSQFFPESRSYLYADEADLDPTLAQPGSPTDTFMLMYDECGRTVPLGPNEYVLVSLKTVEEKNGVEEVANYSVHLFTDGTIIFLDNGVPQTDDKGSTRVKQIAGQRGAVGFGSSPNCAFDHVTAEFEIKLSATGIKLEGGYSPDPLFWGSTTPTPPPNCKKDQITVPLKVNVLKGATITDADIEAIVKKADDILGSANACLEFNKANITRDVSDQGNDDGTVEFKKSSYPNDEWGKQEAACEDELKGTFGSGRGLKVVIANGFGGDLSSSTAGAAFHKGKPCVFVAPGKVTGNDARGNDLAHEVSHKLTNEAHVNDDPNNLMYPYDNGTTVKRGTDLTDAQKMEIQNAAKMRAKNSLHASWLDPANDVSEPQIDLNNGLFFADNLTSDLHIAIDLAGLHPSGTDVHSKFQILVNADDDLGTGSTFGSFAGIDKVLEISLSGRFPFTVPDGSMTATLLDVASGTLTQLSPGIVDRPPLIGDVPEPPEVPGALAVFDSIEQTLSLPLLGLSKQHVPIGIRATDLDSGEFDEASLELEVEELAPPPAGVINNGVVELGINPQADLNVPGGPPSLTGVTTVGLRYLPTGAEATAPGCLCEGWGVADAISGEAGFADVSVDGV